MNEDGVMRYESNISRRKVDYNKRIKQSRRGLSKLGSESHNGNHHHKTEKTQLMDNQSHNPLPSNLDERPRILILGKG